MNFYSGFISQPYRDMQKSLMPVVQKQSAALKANARSEGRPVSPLEIAKIQRATLDRIPRPPLSILIDHIDHITKLAGVDHVGIGSDFDGIYGQMPEGIDSPADLPKITAALLERGYSAEDCRKILGGNLLRVFREVEKISTRLQAEE